MDQRLTLACALTLVGRDGTKMRETRGIDYECLTCRCCGRRGFLKGIHTDEKRSGRSRKGSFRLFTGTKAQAPGNGTVSGNSR